MHSNKVLITVIFVIATSAAGYSFGAGVDQIIRAINGEDFTVSASGLALGLCIAVALLCWRETKRHGE